ncbi:MAG: hypothetical protein K2G27_05525, partial [Duncaniella sp.]|nr:hypothetical protein [Duncaniella sp.]
MLRKIFVIISVIAVLIASSCSDDLSVPQLNGIGPDGEVVLTFDVPALTMVKSRATDPEFQVDDICVLIYTAEDALPAQYEHIYAVSGLNGNNNKLTELSDNKLQLSFKLDKELRNSNLTYYFIANPGNEDDVLKGLTIAGLKAYSVGYVSRSENLTMCATTVSDGGVIRDSPVPLYRNAA